MSVADDCPKCQAPMSPGFVVDQGDYSITTVSTWQSGAPRKSFWSGVNQSEPDQIEITTWRCTRCGYLESYALTG